jgi:hypothetical protein
MSNPFSPLDLNPFIWLDATDPSTLGEGVRLSPQEESGARAQGDVADEPVIVKTQ